MRIKRSAALVTAPIQLPEEVIRTANQSSEFRLHELAKFTLTQVKQRIALEGISIEKGGDDADHCQGDTKALHKLAHSKLIQVN